MELLKLIEGYETYNEQEEKDRELFLKYLSIYDNLYTRENELLHITSSGFIVNKNRDKTLFAYHNIYKSWSWTGGHADGDKDLLKVALKEACEETGIRNVLPVITDIISLDILPVPGHFKRGKYVSSHLHLTLCYLLEGDESEDVKIKEDENSGVRWIPFKEINSFVSEELMKPLYEKIINKIKIL